MSETKDSDPADQGTNIAPRAPPEITLEDKPKSKSKRRRWLLAMLILLVVSTAVFIALFVYYFKMPNNSTGVAPTASEICNTPNCVITASIMAKLMNFTADPCEDFSEFACGTYYRDSKLKEGVYRIGAFEDVGTASDELIKEIVTEKTNPQDPQYLANIKRLYKSCIDLDQIEKIGAGPMLNDTDFINDWPTLNPDWNESDFNLNDLNARYSQVNVRPLYTFNAFVTLEDHARNKLQVNPPDLDLDWPSLLQSAPRVKALQTYLTELAVGLGANPNVSASDARDVVAFQAKIARIINESGRLAIGQKYDFTTLSKLADKCPNIDIVRAMRSTFAVAGIHLPDEFLIVPYPGEYLVLLNNLINQTSPRTLQNLFAFRYAKQRVIDASKYFREIRAKYLKVT